MKMGMIVTTTVTLAALSTIAYAEAKREFSGAEQARQDAEVGYRVAKIKGDNVCKPPKDFNAAGYARPIDILGTPSEPTGYEAKNMKQWSCSYTRSDGTFVQFGSRLTPLEDWRNRQSRSGHND